MLGMGIAHLSAHISPHPFNMISYLLGVSIFASDCSFNSRWPLAIDFLVDVIYNRYISGLFPKESSRLRSYGVLF